MMKKNTIFVLMLVFLLSTVALVITACVRSETDSHNHSFGEWTVTQEATCYKIGTKVRVCSSCSISETEYIDALGHIYSNDLYFDETNHWYICTRCNTAKDSVCLHNLINDVCTVCSYYIPTSGFEFTGYNSNGEISLTEEDISYYKVSGIGTVDPSKNLYFPSTYHDKPVIAINEDAFNNLDTLTGRLKFPSTISYIGDRAFRSCSGLIGDLEIPSSIAEIGEEAFYYCSGLTGNVEFGSNITSITDYSFIGCSNLTKITISDSVLTIGFSPFAECRGLTSLIIPDSVVAIGEQSFRGCVLLTNVKIGKNVVSIGEYAFEGCYNLIEIYNCSNINIILESNDNGKVACYAKNIYTPTQGESFIEIIDDKFIFYSDNDDNYLIGYCGVNADLVLPFCFKGYSYAINQYAFYRNGRINSIEASGNISSIGDYAFEQCIGLTSITLGNHITSIGNNVFSGCIELNSIIIPANIKSISNYAFNGCTRLASVTIENGITSIGYYSFRNCKELISITIPSSVNFIGDDAFYDCDKLIEIYNCSELNLTKGLTNHGYVGYYAKNIYTPIQGQSKMIKTDSGCIFFNDEESYYLIGYIGTEKELVLPEYINGNIYNIYQYAFANNQLIESVVLPNTITTIGNFAFTSCNNLKSLVISNSVTTIDKGAFLGCFKLKSVEIPDSVTVIGDMAFFSCLELASVTIGIGVTSIGQEAFWFCRDLASVTFSNTIGWFITYESSATSGTIINVTESANNVINLTELYGNYYWKRATV